MSKPDCRDPRSHDSVDDRRWYRGGLHFECTQCGRCCTGAPGYVWVGEDEVRALASHLGLELDAFGRKYLRKVGRRYSLVEKPNFDCVFYDHGCTVYAARPAQCRTYPFWPENLQSESAWNEVGAECPGVGSGRFYSADAIEKLVGGEGSADGKKRA